jgi:hypothetical protein
VRWRHAYSDANGNGYSFGVGNANCDCNGHRDSNTDCNGYGYGYGYSYSDCKRYANCHGYFDSQTYAYAAASPDTEAPTNAGAASIACAISAPTPRLKRQNVRRKSSPRKRRRAPSRQIFNLLNTSTISQLLLPRVFCHSRDMRLLAEILIIGLLIYFGWNKPFKEYVAQANTTITTKLHGVGSKLQKHQDPSVRRY